MAQYNNVQPFTQDINTDLIPDARAQYSRILKDALASGFLQYAAMRASSAYELRAFSEARVALTLYRLYTNPKALHLCNIYDICLAYEEHIMRRHTQLLKIRDALSVDLVTQLYSEYKLRELKNHESYAVRKLSEICKVLHNLRRNYNFNTDCAERTSLQSTLLNGIMFNFLDTAILH